MATLSIKDLPDSVELDRQAMAAIIGGARIGARFSVVAQPVVKQVRVVDYPPGFPGARQPIAEALARR
ncbi:hypothetical protein [Paraburkholderia sp.]|jgi:hypothetical protein|uniref:hypothetical protein n=1 Tax=Paraburkholderia sp. TaxID=1926495 RepID=UPI002F402EB1